MTQYKKLGAPDLVDWFHTICGGYINKPRDARMIKTLMEERGLTPVQLVYGMTAYRNMSGTKDVPSFCRAWKRWAEPDGLLAEAELAALVSGQPLPRCALTYMDLTEGVAGTGQQLEDATQQTGEWAHGILSGAATQSKLERGWVARLAKV